MVGPPFNVIVEWRLSFLKGPPIGGSMDTLTIIVIVVAAVILVGAVLLLRYVEGPADENGGKRGEKGNP
jgi:hypothetical protein